jgi:hypothetical protein
MIKVKKIESLLPPNDNEEEIIKRFVESCYDTTKEVYGARNGSTGDKQKADNMSGKRAEVMIYNYIKAQGINVSPVDFKIYGAGEKNYSADLFYKKNELKHNIHVKSCIETRDKSNSWVFQKTDPLVTKPLEGDYLVLVVFPRNALIDNEGYAYLIKADKVAEFYKPLENASLTSKTAIYERDLIKYGSN